MTAGGLAALLYAAATALVVAFQLALAAGAPWGDRAMGGRFPGRFPPALRIGALVQGVGLGLLALVVLDAASVVALGWTAAHPWLPWLPVVVSVASAVMNAASRSAAERRTWLPVGIVMVLSSLVVAAG